MEVTETKGKVIVQSDTDDEYNAIQKLSQYQFVVKQNKVMKVNAPKKLYLRDTGILGDGISTGRLRDTDIEYTRTDAFIDKACELLVNCIEDFMFRRMEIWDEECKNQTLANLRKAGEE